MTKSLSPLRYPGGKTKIYDKVKNLIISNGFSDRTYVEPFGGGFGIGIGLLSEGVVSSAIYNDYDSHIYHFWYSVLHDTERLIHLINETPVTIEERSKQINIYRNKRSSVLNDGFATLYLNRVNFSGVIKGGPIGGFEQLGNYKIDCRFNKKTIIKKINTIAEFKNNIKLYNKDASELIKRNLIKYKSPLFLNIDPPYVAKGNGLYSSFFKPDDHKNLELIIAKYLTEDYPWIVTYDDCKLVRSLYNQYTIKEFQISYNAREIGVGNEIVITNIAVDKMIW